jgi:lysophospholipid acyltransferase (LPLAT)-like uncharacterized protein
MSILLLLSTCLSLPREKVEVNYTTVYTTAQDTTFHVRKKMGKVVRLWHGQMHVFNISPPKPHHFYSKKIWRDGIAIP